MASQHRDVAQYFEAFFEDMTGVALILELGTAQGGFTLLLDHHRARFPGARLVTVDHVPLAVPFDNPDIELWERDLNTMDALVELGFLIRASGKTLLFCDNGNKIQEFSYLSQFLKPGDHILVHDYFRSDEEFSARFFGKIWNWCECTYKDIAKAVEKSHLVPYRYEELLNCAWGSFRKEEAELSL